MVRDLYRQILACPNVSHYIGGHKYESNSDGRAHDFTLDGHPFVQNLGIDLSSHSSLLLSPRELGFWKVQCQFRGLPSGGHARVLKDLLRSRGHEPMLEEFKQRGADCKREYEEKKDKLKAKLWDDCENDEERMMLDPERELLRLFPVDGADADGADEPIIFQYNDNTCRISRTADCYIKHIVGHDHERLVFKDGMQVGSERYQIVGRDRAKVFARRKALVIEAEMEWEKAMSDRQVRALRSNEHFIRESVKAGADWDVSGVYVVHCPDIDQRWQSDHILSLEIYTMGSGSKRQMYAEFHFGVVQGYIRFENPAETPQPVPHVEPGKKRKMSEGEDSKSKSKRRKSGEDDWVTDDEDADEDKAAATASKCKVLRIGSPPNFVLGANDKPSAMVSKWAYRWRGTEASRGQYACGGTELSHIRFAGPGGTHLCGYLHLESWCAAGFTFTAVKIANSRSDKQSPNIEEEWKAWRHFSGR